MHCPPGYWLTLRGVTHVPNSGVAECAQCPYGTACPGGGVGAAIVLPCAAQPGSFCPQGNALPEGVPCPAGYACGFNSSALAAAAASAAAAAANASAPSANATASDGQLPLPAPCAPGSFSEPGAANCTTCPLGFYGWEPAASSLQCSGVCGALPGSFCPPGSTSAGGAPCLAGYTCAGGGAPPLPCSPGSYSLAGASTCTPCPFNVAGTRYGLAAQVCSGTFTYSASAYYPVGSAEPVLNLVRIELYNLSARAAPITNSLCQPGTYTPNFANASACEPCPPGFVCAGGNAAPSACAPPLFAPGGTSACGGMANSSVPVLNTANFTPPSAPAALALWYSPWAKGLRQCPPGTYGNGAGGGCSACAVGTFSPAPGALGGCPGCYAAARDYCPPASVNGAGIACPANATCAGGAAGPVCSAPGSVFNMSNGNTCTPCWPGALGGRRRRRGGARRQPRSPAPPPTPPPRAC